MRRASGWLLLAGMAGWAGAARAQTATGLPSLIIEVESDSLKDVAVAVYTPYRGIIYYNPSLLSRVGPALSSFFRAHEYGHLFYHHTRGHALAGVQQADDRTLQARELEADCYAARRLNETQPAAVSAAVEFFSRMGSFRYDTQHPTGAQRAAMILACERS